MGVLLVPNKYREGQLGDTEGFDDSILPNCHAGRKADAVKNP